MELRRQMVSTNGHRVVFSGHLEVLDKVAESFPRGRVYDAEYAGQTFRIWIHWREPLRNARKGYTRLHFTSREPKEFLK